MKLTALLLTIVFVNVHASSRAQRVTLHGANIPLKNVFSAIEKQTEYLVFGSEAVIKNGKAVTIAAENLPIREFLDLAFKNQPFTYQINSRTITFVQKTRLAVLQTPDTNMDEAAFAPIRGKVADSSGVPLEGVSILHEKGGQVKTYATTDAKGEFLLNAEKGDALTFSFVGFEMQKIVVGRQQFIEVRMKRQQQKLAEVNITQYSTGYQKIRPEHSTGAISVISTKAYESRVNSDFISGLTNRLPGLMINNDVKFTSSINGTTTTNNLFNVRGISTISANQNPLIVLDGYPTELSLNMINPNEIESVTLLKDAASATVYGVRASNGVIIVQRKKAVAGKPSFNFRTNFDFRRPENYNRRRWDDNASGINVDFNREMLAKSVDGTTWNRIINSGYIYTPVHQIMARRAANIITQDQAEIEFENLRQYDNKQDYARLFLRPELNQTYLMDISGGSAAALYYFTARYSKKQGQQMNSGENMLQLSARTSLQLSKRLSLQLNTDFGNNEAGSVPVPEISSLQPYERLQDENGRPQPIISGSVINPYYNQAIMKQGLMDHLHYPLEDLQQISKKTNTISNRITADLNYRIGGGFNFRFGGVYETSKSDSKDYAKEESYLARQYVNSYTQLKPNGDHTYHIPKGGFMRQLHSGNSGYTLIAQLNYDKQILRDHFINGIVGAEMRNMTEQSSSAAYFGYDDETLLQVPVDYAAVVGFRNKIVEPNSIDYASLFRQTFVNNRFLSGFSNIIYSFRGKYSLGGSLRVEQSNLFGTNPKYKYKPLWSVSGAWNMHKEKFMSGLTWLNELKLRVSTGFNGNLAKNALPRVIARSEVNPFGQTFFNSLRRESFANSALRWEQTNNFNAGFDVRVFKTINLTVEVYRKKSMDLLSREKINPTLGGGPTFINTASILNKGMEFNLQADWIAKPRFNWNTGIVFGANTSKTLKVYQINHLTPDYLNSSGYMEGYPLGPLFGYRYAGIDKAGSPLVKTANGEVYSPSQQEGRSKMVNRSTGIMYFAGSTLPRFNMGFSNRFDIGNFYLFTMVDYYGGFKVMAARPSPLESRPLEGAGEYWKQPGDELKSEVISLAAFSNSYSKLAYEYADVNIVNGDYITLKNVTLSYNFAEFPVIKRMGVRVFEVKLQAANIFTVGLNKYNYSKATGSFVQTYLVPTYTFALSTSF
ncbi:SusC/RagA family TonB-linked outer membrane protein [Chitinophaga pollutisoli]|uniref:SusC/RagA family TonB-linked outer membrane protein n=1 Tax=Chitinophaga pollutisoli TaxID=3133966 RepID=A0ABZ2YR80_9BACT